MGGSCINPVSNNKVFLSTTSFSNLMDSKYLAYYTKVTMLLSHIPFLYFFDSKLFHSTFCVYSWEF